MSMLLCITLLTESDRYDYDYGLKLLAIKSNKISKDLSHNILLTYNSYS